MAGKWRPFWKWLTIKNFQYWKWTQHSTNTLNINFHQNRTKLNFWQEKSDGLSPFVFKILQVKIEPQVRFSIFFLADGRSYLTKLYHKKNLLYSTLFRKNCKNSTAIYPISIFSHGGHVFWLIKHPHISSMYLMLINSCTK